MSKFSIHICESKIDGADTGEPYYLCRISAGTLHEHFRAYAGEWSCEKYITFWNDQLKKLTFRNEPAFLIKSIYGEISKVELANFYYFYPTTINQVRVHEQLLFFQDRRPKSWTELEQTYSFIDSENDSSSVWQLEKLEIKEFFDKQDWTRPLTLRD
jgi:hypothetical protein